MRMWGQRTQNKLNANYDFSQIHLVNSRGAAGLSDIEVLGRCVRLDARFLPSSNRQHKTDKQIDAIVVEWVKHWKTKTHHHKYTFVQMGNTQRNTCRYNQAHSFSLLRCGFRCMCVCVSLPVVSGIIVVVMQFIADFKKSREAKSCCNSEISQAISPM